MTITGIEVVRRNPGVAMGVVAGEKVELTFGDTLRVNVSFHYRGLAQTVALYGAIGNSGFFGFDEILHNEVNIELSASPADFTPYQRSVDIPITSEISPGPDYDLYCKIKEYPEAGMPQVDDVIDIVGLPPEYVLIQHAIYPWAYVFEGDAQTCIFEFKLTPEQIPTYPWLGERIVDALVSELEKEGSRLLELKVYEDTTPALWTNYRVEVTATASPIAWMPIIIAVLAILFIVAVIFLLRTIDDIFFKRKPLDEETKKTFSRETLTAMILDLAPETPPETLGGMEDQELRDLLNRLLAEVAPPMSWWPLALVGGIGILGVGAAAAFAMARRPGGE